MTYYYLTSQQYNKLFKNVAVEFDGSKSRLLYFAEHYPNLTYIESSIKTSKLYYGRISGNEKDINWFLLQL